MVIKEIGNLCSHFDLTDIWRPLNPQTFSFTWHDKAFKTQSRLDFFSITPHLVNTTKECNIMHTPFSDHSSIMLNLQSLDQHKRSGPGFWKFNANLLEDEKHVKEMPENILYLREKYNDVTDLGLKWDLIEMKIRSFTLQYSKKKARIERDEEKEWQIKMNNLPGKKHQRLSQSRKTKFPTEKNFKAKTI